MSNKVISILGCGWLGKALGKMLAASGYSVMGSVTRNEKIGELQSAGINPFVLNVNALPSPLLQEFFTCDVLVISLPHGVRSNKAQDYGAQIDVVIDSAKERTKHIILISTTSVYPNVNRVVTEDDADPDNPIVKAEQKVLDSGIPATVLRFAGLYGPGRHPGNFLANKRNLPGANGPVNMIHLDDCIAVIHTILKTDRWNTILNACADEHPTRKEFYTNAALSIGVEPPIFSEEKQDYKIVSNDRLKDTLQYAFAHRLL